MSAPEKRHTSTAEAETPEIVDAELPMAGHSEVLSFVASLARLRIDKELNMIQALKLLSRPEIRNTPEVQEAIPALLRTFANLGISVIDLIPAFGDSVSFTADAGKVVDWLTTRFCSPRSKLHRLGSMIDLTPDASLALALGTELLEIKGMGVAPTHVIETWRQLQYDIPRIRAGTRKAIELSVKLESASEEE